MAEPDAFDPTHALDGWRVPVSAPPDLQLSSLRRDEAAGADEVDPTHLLDDWHAPEPAPLDLQLKPPPRAEATALDKAKLARLKARGYEMVDVEDIEVTDLAPRRLAIEAPVLDITPPPAEPEMPPPVFFAEATVQEVQPPPPAEPDAQQGVVPIRLFEDSPEASLPEQAEPVAVEPLPAVVETPAPALEEAGPPEAPLPAAADVVAPELQPAAAPAEAGAPLTSEAIEAMPAPAEAPPAQAVEPAAEAPPPDVESAPPAVPDPVQPAEEIEVPEVPPPAVVEGPVLDFHAPPPPPDEPDAQSLLGSIKLPQVAPPPAFEAPVLDFQLPPAPPEPDAQQVLDTIALPVVPPQAFDFEAPVLDMAALAPRAEADPRLLAQWQPTAWTALARRISGPNTEVSQAPDGLHVQTHAPQWLCALWPPRQPDAPWMGRWPELATLVEADTRDGALKALLAELPTEACLWAAELDADWRLVAELVLRQDAGLRPAQAQALRELAEAENDAGLQRLRDGYRLDGRVARRRS